jgi:DNA gyrase subunit A
MALNVIDDVIKIIKKSKDKNIARDSLKKKLPKLTLFQIDAILDMKLSSLTNLEINKLVDEKNEKENKVKELIEDLKEENICKRIIDEQNEYKKKYGYPLRTEYQDIDTNITTEDIIEKEDCVLVLTNDNYIKRLSADKFKTQKRNTQGNNITNSVKDIFSTNTKDHLLCFTNLGRVFDIKVYNINEGSIKSKGMRIPLNLKPDEKVIKFLCLSDEKISDPNSYLMFVTKNGLGKRTSLEEFKNINKAGIIAIDLKENDKIVFVGYIDNNKDIQDIIIATENGLTVRYDKEQFKPIGRTTQGNVVMKLLDDDHIASACIIDDENDKIFFITQNGLGKTTLVTDNVKKKDPNTKKEVIINDGFPRLKRSATIKGRIGITLKNDKLVEIIPIHNNDDIKDIIITTKQKVLTISTEEFLEPLKRATMGKKLINIKDENDFIVNIALR